jgi:hypothetical protein
MPAGRARKWPCRLGIAVRRPSTTIRSFYSRERTKLLFNTALLRQASNGLPRRTRCCLATCGAKNLFFNFWFLGKTWQATGLNAVLQVPLMLP